jgi:hypothetical protein
MTKQSKIKFIALALLIALCGTIPAAAQNSFGADRIRLKKTFLNSTIALDITQQTITLPLFSGIHNGSPVWYIVTESSDKKDARRRGVNWSPKLVNALGTAAVQTARTSNSAVNFAGTVDFSPTRILVNGPEGFPPLIAVPGAVGDTAYSPLFTTGNGIVLNASHVANNTGLHDSVVSIDFGNRTVTLSMLAGFYDDDGVLYLRVDASTGELAAIEGSTFAANLNAAPTVGSSEENSARAAIIPIVNGERGVSNPERQGLQSALLGEGDPLNIIEEEPGDDDYSPIWDVHPAVWSQAASNAGLRRRLTSLDEVADEFARGNIISGGTGPANPAIEGLRAADFISNCPVTALLHVDMNTRGRDNNDSR